MRILAFETSAKAASVALLTDGNLTGEFFQNSGETHSRTVLRLAEELLKSCNLSPAEIDAVAWANGPGSFTGVRIGAAAAKGFCWGRELPALPVSTLEAMAWNLADLKGILCCCMDARRNQVYNALFRSRDGRPVRLREDRALSLDELAEDLRTFQEPIFLLGDGALLTWTVLHEQLAALILVSEHLRQQRAAGVALAGWDAVLQGRTEAAASISPNYLRLSQAERERREKESSRGE